MIGPTVWDDRGGQPDTWVSLPEGVERLMQVPDAMRKAVVFLYCTRKGQRVVAGTGFFVGCPIVGHPNPAIPESTFAVLLTANHVIAAIRQHSDDGKVFVRFNTLDDGSDTHECRVDDWLHEASDVDCALLMWRPLPEQNADMVSWDISRSVANDEVIRREGIGLGDEVFTVGLFRSHAGRARIEPIVRIGNIAAMPAEPIKTRMLGDMHAIFIESRSIGGLSGSPVFVHQGFLGVDREKGQLVYDVGGRPFYLLGLMHGHWDAMDVEPDKLLIDQDVGKINSGIAIVVPIQQIMETYAPLLRHISERLLEAWLIENEPTPDTAIANDADGDDGGEFDSFDALASKLVQVPKSEIDQKRKEQDS